MTTPPQVSVIVVSYNTRDMTLACLESVRAQTDPGLYELVVVDNASEDGSADAIERAYPDIRLIRSDENIGFAAANNLASTHTRGRRLLLLNPDTVVLDRAIERVVAFADAHPENRIYGGRTLFADGSLNPYSCWRRQTAWGLLMQALGLSSLRRRSSVFNPEAFGAWDRSTVREVDIIAGCFLLIDAPLWQDLGGFDTSFFMYGEEADLCLRARRLGARPIMTPEASLIHYAGQSERVRADKMVRLLRAKVALVRRHWRRWTVPIGVCLLAAWPLSRMLAWRVVTLVRRRGREQRDCWTAIVRQWRSWIGGWDAAPPAGRAPGAMPDGATEEVRA